MYEQLKVHAIQHPKEKGFQLRYRFYNSERERDEIYEAIKNSVERTKDPIERVTLTITAETVADQLTLEL